MIKFLFYFGVLILLVVILSFLAKKILKKHFVENNLDLRKDGDIKVLPIDANDVQNLDKKYCHNVYRGTDGKFKSLKK